MSRPIASAASPTPARERSTSSAAPSVPAVRSSASIPISTSSSSSVATVAPSREVGAAETAVQRPRGGEHLLPVRGLALVPLRDEVLRHGLASLAAGGVGGDRRPDAVQQVPAFRSERAGDLLVGHPL